MPASAVSSPTASTRTRTDESVDTVPATTRSPGPLATGLDSPVIIDSSSSAAPSTIVPSAGTRPPARTSTTSPTPELGERDRAHVVAVDDLGLVGQQLGQRRQRAAGLADRLHLLPVAEQHDRHQRGQLPPELQVEPVEARGHRRDVGDRDRHRDEQHHPGLAVADLGHAAGEERPAAPPEHERAEHRPDPRHPREVERVAEPVHDHLAGDDERDRQQQAEPEAPAEHLRVVAGVLVVAAVGRLVVHRCLNVLTIYPPGV